MSPWVAIWANLAFSPTVAACTNLPPGGSEVAAARNSRAGDQHCLGESRRARGYRARLAGPAQPAPQGRPCGDGKADPGPDRAAQQHVAAMMYAGAYPGPGNGSGQRQQHRRQAGQLPGHRCGERERRRRMPRRERPGWQGQLRTAFRPLAAGRGFQQQACRGRGDGDRGQPACRAMPGPPSAVRQSGADRHPEQRMVRGAAEHHEEPVRSPPPGVGPAVAGAVLGGRASEHCTHALMVGARASWS